MAKERKTPQEKKHLEYTKDHFTFGRWSSREFPKTWKRKKNHANREYRHKSEQILSKTKTGVASQDFALLADDLSAGRFAKSVIRKSLHKTDTVTLEEKVRLKLSKREQTSGRRVKIRAAANQEATSVIQTLTSLEDERFVDFVHVASALCTSRNPRESVRLQLSDDPIDQALHFIYRLHWGVNSPRETVCRDKRLRERLADWLAKANRLLKREERKVLRKMEQKKTTGIRVNTLRRVGKPSS